MSGLLPWAAVLTAFSATTLAATPVGDTSWVVQDPDRWRADELQVLRDLASALPDSLTHAGSAVVLRKADLSRPGEPAHALHGVARWRGRGVVEVDDEPVTDRLAAELGLPADDAGVEAAGRELLRRHLVHAFTHLADHEATWSSSGVWRRLSEWEQLPTSRARERDPGAFALPEGRRTPAEDLATAAELYFRAEPLPWDAARYPGCGLRSKWRFVRDHLGGDSPAFDACASVAAVSLDPEQIAEIDLVYIQASMRSAASLAGHLALALVYRTERGPQRVDAYQLAADTTARAGRKGPLYLLRGLSGGFPSIVQSEPYARLVLRYARENRSVRRLRLRLDEVEKHRLIERLDDARQSWDRPYLFMTRNCAFLPRTLLEWAFGEKIRIPDLHAPDALLGALERMGRVTPIPATTLDEFNRFERAEIASLLREPDAEQLRSAFPELADDLGQEGGSRRAREEMRAREFEQLGELATSEATADLQTHQSLARYFAWSEEVERLRLQRSKGAVGAIALDALWSARGSLAASDHEAGRVPVGDGGVGSDLLSALNKGAEEARVVGGANAHTALRRVDLELGARAVDEELAGVVSVASSAYGYQLGESRRYTLARGLDLRLLDSRLTLVLTPDLEPELESRLNLLQGRRIVGGAPLANPGLYLSVMAFERTSGVDPRAALDFAEGGVVLELWQADDHRHHLGVSAGILGGVTADAVFAPTSTWTLRSGLPVRLFSRLGSRREPMSGLALDAWWTLPPPWTSELAADGGGRANARVRVGAVGGADVAISASWSTRFGEDDQFEHTITQGVVVERF